MSCKSSVTCSSSWVVRRMSHSELGDASTTLHQPHSDQIVCICLSLSTDCFSSLISPIDVVLSPVVFSGMDLVGVASDCSLNNPPLCFVLICGVGCVSGSIVFSVQRISFGYWVCCWCRFFSVLAVVSAERCRGCNVPLGHHGCCILVGLCMICRYSNCPGAC